MNIRIKVGAVLGLGHDRVDNAEHQTVVRRHFECIGDFLRARRIAMNDRRGAFGGDD